MNQERLVLKTGSGALAATLNLEDLRINSIARTAIKTRLNAALAEMQAKGILKESTTAFFPESEG